MLPLWARFQATLPFAMEIWLFYTTIPWTSIVSIKTSTLQKQDIRPTISSGLLIQSSFRATTVCLSITLLFKSTAKQEKISTNWHTTLHTTSETSMIWLRRPSFGQRVLKRCMMTSTTGEEWEPSLVLTFSPSLRIQSITILIIMSILITTRRDNDKYFNLIKY